jgi:hypothetical protein
MRKENNIDWNNIISIDIETSRVTPDEVSINGHMPDDEETPYDGKKDIQIPFLTNILEMDMRTGTIKSSKFGRTIEEMVNQLKSISSEDNVRVVYAHNLFYELTFIKNQYKATFMTVDDKLSPYGHVLYDGIMRSTTDIVYARLDCCPNIIFRDSMALFNKTINQMGEDLNELTDSKNYSKLEYDYDAVRLPWDDLTKHDYDYNQRDNEIVLYSLYHYLKTRNLTMEDVPLTSTSYTKRLRKDTILKTFGKEHLKQINNNKFMSCKEFDFYTIQKLTYQGGFTGANPKFVDKLVKDVYSVDLKSSYPFQMCNLQFPIFDRDTTYYFEGDEAHNFYSDFLKGRTHNDLQILDSGEICGYYALIELENVRIKNENFLLDMSLAHCKVPDEYKGKPNRYTDINGKLKQADYLSVCVNSLDMERLNLLYDYDNLIVSELWMATRSRQLPLGEVHFILSNFANKENIDKDSFPLEYDLSKIVVNSMYGVKVQNEIKDETTLIEGKIDRIKYDDLPNESIEVGELSQQSVYENYMSKQQRMYAESPNFDIYSDGVHITSAARLSLMKMMVRLTEEGFIVVYSDTDSLKFIASEELKNKLNNNLKIKNTRENKTKLKISEKKTNKKDSECSNSTILYVVKNLIKGVNKNIINDNTLNGRFQEFVNILIKEDKVKNVEEYMKKVYRLGIWEIESVGEQGEVSPYPFFKTLGAKKYCYYAWNKKKGKYVIHTTVAGCSKKSFATAITNFQVKSEYSIEEAIDYIFTTGTLVDESASGRTVASYETRSLEECLSLTYKGKKLNSGGGIIINKTTYLLNVSKTDAYILPDLLNYKREDYVKVINIDGDIEGNEKKSGRLYK